MGNEIRAVVKTFFNADAILSAAEKGRLRALSGGGALIRGIARRSFKRPPRMSLSSMTRAERIAWERRLRSARRKGEPTPKRPFAHAPKGKPPYNRTGAVKDKIFFGLNAAGDDVSVGAVLFKSGTVGLLEHGGDATLPGPGQQPVRMHFDGNPFMEPALEAALPKVPALFQGIVR